MSLNRIAVLLIFVLGFGSSFASAQPLTTAFTYQGELRSGGVPAAGLHDFRFRLYDNISVGAPVGSAVCIDNVNVAAGRFTVSLDFGAVFTGEQRFLEIEARADTGADCSSNAGFVVLSPRQPLTAAPNALFALSATQFNGQPPAFYQNAANLTTGTLDAARLPSPLMLSGSTGSAIVRGTNSSTAIGTVGVLGLCTGATGQSVGVFGESFSTLGIGVYGYSDSETGMTYGVIGENYSTQGKAVAGLAVADEGFNVGIYGETHSPDGLGVQGVATSGSGTGSGVFGSNNSATGRGVSGQATATTGLAFGVFGQSASNQGYGVYGRVSAATPSTNGVNAVVGEATATSGLATGGRFTSESTGGRGVVGGSNAATGFTFGVQGFVGSPNGQAVFGYATSTTGPSFAGSFVNNSSAGTGVYGEANSPTGTTYGGRFANASSTGTAVYGEANSTTGATFAGRFENGSSSGKAIYATASATAGNTYAIHGRNSSTGGIGVYGETLAIDGQSNGGRFITNSRLGGEGLHAEASNAQAIGSTYGVWSQSSGTFGVGVFGQTLGNTASAFGVFCGGKFSATGTKAFRIDHPDDPANKYLQHYSAESPEVINFYRGTVMLDSAGEAIVNLPRYFARINKQPSYMLTAIGAAMPNLHIAVEINEASLALGAAANPSEIAPACSFRIAGGAAGRKVSWRVEAVRNDKWMQAYSDSVQVEVEKPEFERGTYQHPELFGQPTESRLNYSSTQVAHKID